MNKFFLGVTTLICLASITVLAKTPEELIIENPVREYKKYSQRLRKYGPNAPFPEFKPIVDEIVHELSSAEFQAKLNEHFLLRMEFDEVMTYLTHINLTFSYEDRGNYPYVNGYDHPFPYRPTIDAIEAALRLFDKVERLYNPEIVPLYHFDRYAYHRHALLADLNNVIFPTMKTLSFSDLIRVRSVPIGFVGVTTRAVRVDRYLQSPLDFWYHDMNHIRRLIAYLRLKLAEARVTTVAGRIKIYQEMDHFIANVVMPSIHKLPQGSPAQAVAVRRLVRLIFFEIFHESAVAPDPESIRADLLRGPDVKTPFEYMRLQPVTNIEELRTAVGNVQSGARTISEVNPQNHPVHVRYFHDRDLGLLANLYNKLIYGYYDEPGKPSELIAPVAFRRVDYLVKAAHQVLDVIGFNSQDYPAQHLRELALSRDGRPELFNYEQIKPHEADLPPAPIATDPITADEVIEQVKKLGKRIHTLFGFADSEYEHKSQVMAHVRAELKQLGPQTTIINIGATEDGIGSAYEIAKELGFETIGMVSMRALSYSGKFSSFVDRIYIINDNYWGGYLPGTKELTQATRAYIEVSDSISAYGGGLNTAAALEEALRVGIPVKFTPAEMNHRKRGHVENVVEPYIGAAERFWRKQGSCSAVLPN